MYSLSILFAASFILSIVLTLLCRDLCIRFEILDHPDDERKLHAHPVPRLGGVAIAISYVGALSVLMAVGTQGGSLIESSLPLAWLVLPAAAMVFFTGLLDDLFNISALNKLAGLTVAAVIAYAAGIHVKQIGGIELAAWLDFVLTVVWLLACSNAFNLIDGMDGLAAGLGCFAAATAFVAALLQGNFPLALATIPLVGCLLGFLIFNFNPASIFLGDSGSLVIGFLLGSYALIWGQKAATTFALVAPLIGLAIPLFDTSLAVMRRSLRNRPIFGADRGHIHHLLLDRGLSPRRAVLLLYGIASLCAVFALAAGMTQDRVAGLVIIAFGIVVLTAIHFLRLAEFEAVKRMFIQRTFQRLLDSQLNLQAFEKSLAASQTLEESWSIIRNESQNLGFVRVELSWHGAVMSDTFRKTVTERGWRVQIPVAEHTQIDLEHDQSYSSLGDIGPFLDILSRQLQLKESAGNRRGRTRLQEAVSH